MPEAHPCVCGALFGWAKQHLIGWSTVITQRILEAAPSPRTLLPAGVAVRRVGQVGHGQVWAKWAGQGFTKPSVSSGWCAQACCLPALK